MSKVQDTADAKMLRLIAKELRTRGSVSVPHATGQILRKIARRYNKLLAAAEFGINNTESWMSSELPEGLEKRETLEELNPYQATIDEVKGTKSKKRSPKK